MRNIKFRGFSKNLTNNEWVYGDLVNYSETEKIIVEQNSKTWDLLEGGTIVNEKSIGQFTGLTDKNGKEIYEGDIVTDGVGKYKIVYDLKLAGYQPYCIFRDNPENYCEVIGNVFENADLVKL